MSHITPKQLSFIKALYRSIPADAARAITHSVTEGILELEDISRGQAFLLIDLLIDEADNRDIRS